MVRSLVWGNRARYGPARATNSLPAGSPSDYERWPCSLALKKAHPSALHTEGKAVGWIPQPLLRSDSG